MNTKNTTHTTIDDVAQMCGVSKSTVSRALNRPEMVSAEVRQKVEDAARLLCYRPNPIARALNGYERSVVTMVLPAHYLFAQTDLMAGCQEELQKNGHSLLLLDNSTYSKRTGEYMQVLRQQVTNGVIFCFELEDRNILEMQKNTPAVSFGLASPNRLYSSVMVDDYVCIRLALEHLVGLGHRKIAAIVGRLGDAQSKMHIKNFTRVMREMGLEIAPGWICATKNWENTSGYEAVEELLTKERRPTALYCANGNLGLGALIGLQHKGLTVPKDMSIICANGPPPERLFTFSLDTVDVDHKMIGAKLATLLLNQMTGMAGGYEQVVITPTAIRVGESAGPVGMG